MQRTIFIIFILIGSLNYIHGQKIEPIEIAKKLMSKEPFIEIDNYSTREFNSYQYGLDLDEKTTTNYKVLGQTEKHAVVNVTLRDSLNNGIDLYLHFKKDSNWKISANRSLAMTGILEQMKIELEQMTDSQIDDFILSEKNKENRTFSSKSDIQYMIRNLELTLKSDDSIVDHFNSNRKKFNRLRDLAIIELKTKEVDLERSYRLLKNLESDIKKLDISSVSTGGYELGNCINFTIGGLVDNSVGYIFVENRSHKPEMNQDRIIMIREIGNGWYMYKTT